MAAIRVQRKPGRPPADRRRFESRSVSAPRAPRSRRGVEAEHNWMATTGAADGRFLHDSAATHPRSFWTGRPHIRPRDQTPRKKRPSTGSTAPPRQQPDRPARARRSRFPGQWARSAPAAHGGEAWQLPRIVGIFGRMVGIGVLSLVALALRPEFSTPARMPPTARSAPRGGRQGLLVLTAGLVGPPVPALLRSSGGSVTTE